MPELPEVEAVRRGLERELVGRSIVDVDVLVPKILRPPLGDPIKFSETLQNRRVESVSRRGKHLILSLSCGYSLAAHLKMRGQMRVAPADAFLDDRYLCARMRLDDGREWRFYDSWTWGELRLMPVETAQASKYIPALIHIGPEPLGEEFTGETLLLAARIRPRSSIKALLLDQSVVAGIGNIYADESLWRAGVLPATLGASLDSASAGRLQGAIRAVLEEAIAASGTISDNFVGVEGSAGQYVPDVYGRGGKECRRCGQMLQRTVVASRGTVFCIGCQK
jgi:formamidopyrimidine-DNA glycosylase